MIERKAMTKQVLAALACAGVMAWGAVQAAQGDWLARARLIHINPDTRSSALNIDVNSKVTPKLNFSYFVANNLALELIVATHKHDVTAGSALTADKSSWGPAVQAGIDIGLDERFLPNIDVKKMWMDTDRKSGGDPGDRREFEKRSGDYGYRRWHEIPRLAPQA